MRTSLLIAAVIAVATIISAHAANTRGALRSPGITNANDDHTDLVAGYDSSASASAVHAQMTDVDFGAHRKIYDVRADISAQLQKVRGALKSEFGKLEKTIKDRINAIFNIACAAAVDGQSAGDAANNFAAKASNCWVAMKVECQLFDVLDFIHGHRTNLVGNVKNKLNGMLVDFDTYLQAKGMGCDDIPFNSAVSCNDAAAMDTKQCKCNAKHSIDGMLGMYLQDGDSFDDGQTVKSTCKKEATGKKFEDLWSAASGEQCAEFNICIENAAPCTAASSDFCHDQVSTDHSCIEKHPAFNKDDDPCVKGHLGMLGILNYYGGDEDATSQQLGRVGRMIDGAFECSLAALDDSKLSCLDSERHVDSHKCVDSSCDCACACEKHHSDETEAKCANQGGPEPGKPWVGAAPTHSDGDAALHAATCGDAAWRTNNQCPAAVAMIQ